MLTPQKNKMIVLGTNVPEVSNPHAEICHTFVYRFLIARGIYKGSYPDPKTELNDITGAALLWPVMGAPARTGGALRIVLPGDIIGFFDGDHLVHSMVAITFNSWVGANNAGCFGTGTGRTIINDVNGGFAGALIPNESLRMGWVGTGNQWRTMGGKIVNVFYRTPYLKTFPKDFDRLFASAHASGTSHMAVTLK